MARTVQGTSAGGEATDARLSSADCDGGHFAEAAAQWRLARAERAYMPTDNVYFGERPKNPHLR